MRSWQLGSKAEDIRIAPQIDNTMDWLSRNLLDATRSTARWERISSMWPSSLSGDCNTTIMFEMFEFVEEPMFCGT